MIGNKSKFRIKINEVYQDIGFITEISRLQSIVDEVDTTRYNSVVKEARPTMRSGGTVSLKINYNRTSNINREIESIFKQNKVSDFELYINDDIGTTKRFKAFFKSFGISVPNQDNVNIDVSLVVVSDFDTLYSATGSINFVNTSSSVINLPLGSEVYIVKNGVRHDYRTLNYTSIGANATRSINVVCMIAGSTGNTVNNTTMQTDIVNVTPTTNGGLINGGSLYPGTTITIPDPEPPPNPDPDPTPTTGVAANFQNSYLGGAIFISQDNEILSSASGWGNSGGWDDTPITGDGSISTLMTSASADTEQVFGLSYKNSEADAQDLSFLSIDYSWYFEGTSSKAYILESGGQSGYTAQAYSNTGIYSIARTGTVITYLIDGSVVHTSNVAATTADMYFDVSFNILGARFKNMRIVR